MVGVTAPPEVLKAQRYKRAIKREEELQDLVAPVFFPAPPDAGFITGQTLNVDGGGYMV